MAIAINLGLNEYYGKIDKVQKGGYYDQYIKYKNQYLELKNKWKLTCLIMITDENTKHKRQNSICFNNS